MSAIWARVGKNAAMIGNIQKCFCFLSALQSRLRDVHFHTRILAKTACRKNDGNSGRLASISLWCSKRIRSSEEAQVLEQWWLLPQMGSSVKAFSHFSFKKLKYFYFQMFLRSHQPNKVPRFFLFFFLMFMEKLRRPLEHLHQVAHFPHIIT